MGDVAAELLPWARLALVVMFSVLALVAVVRAPRSGPAGWWVAATFGSLALALVAGQVADLLGKELPGWLTDLTIVLILIFPYLLVRFTASFRDLPRWLEVAAALTTVAVTVATLVLPSLPEGGAHPPSWVAVYIPVVLAYWVLLSLVSVVSLWGAGRGQPTVARRRMRLMSVATALLAMALLMAGLLNEASPLWELSVQVAALASAAVFGLGFQPPRALRLSWRRAEEEHLQRGTMAVLRATTAKEVARELLPPTVRMVDGAGAAFVDGDGRVVAAYGMAPRREDLTSPEAVTGKALAREVVPLGEGRGTLVVWTSRYTRFFGREETELLRTMASVAALALERCELLAGERARRVALEEAQRDSDQARAEADRANLAKSEFLSRMSHELRTPLNAILGFGQLLDIADLGPEEREGVGHILKAGRHLLALINDVLELSRIEAGMLTVSMEPVHAGELIHDAVALIRPLADNRSIRLGLDAGGCGAYVMTDHQRCRQILLNLLSNAVKYNRDGGAVGVTCDLLSRQILRITVRDTGPGIDPARQARLFQPFDRLGAEASGVEGTGLGLALTKQLIEHLGGSIGVDTAPGQGATFWIDLPVTDPPAAVVEPDRRSHTPAATSDRTLLLVEDNLANLRVVEAMLRQRPGMTVLPAMQGRLAIDLAREHQPDVIVLDLHLPDITGREVLHRLQADPRTRDIPVVIASADAGPGRGRQLKEDGAFAYVTKPLHLGTFMEILDAAVGGRNPDLEQGPESPNDQGWR